MLSKIWPEAKHSAMIESRETDSGVQLYKTGSKKIMRPELRLKQSPTHSPAPQSLRASRWCNRLRTCQSERKQAEIDGVNPGDLNGIYVNGTSYVVADNHATVAEAVRTAVHEEVGHLGIRGLLGRQTDAHHGSAFTAVWRQQLQVVS